MNFGYQGKILVVNLGEGKLSIYSIEGEPIIQLIGGTGLATKFLWEKTDIQTHPLSPDNPIIFMVGPLTDVVPSSSRYIVASLSPLTGIWGESHAGGTWGSSLKRSGFDGVIILGKAKEPNYLIIRQEEPRLMDASHLWGKDTYETTEILKKELGTNLSVICIGPAGENQVKMASIMGDGFYGRAAARCGLGAVMGSKKLKAIALGGSIKTPIYNDENLRKSISRYLPRSTILEKDILDKKIKKRKESRYKMGRVPFKNFSEGFIEGFIEKMDELMESGKPSYCRGCYMGCIESSMINGKKRPVYQALAPLGAYCLIDDMNILSIAFEKCNRLGLDTISTGASVAFAMEAFDKGIIRENDTDGISLQWGNGQSLLKLIDQIAYRKGIGTILGEGVKRASEIIGKESSTFAQHVKGLEIPAWEPRASYFRAIEYATSNRGACHVSGFTLALEFIVSEDLGFTKIQDDETTRFLLERKGEITSKMQNFTCLLNSLVVCALPFIGFVTRTWQQVKPTGFLEWLRWTTGFDLDLNEFLKIGERIFNMQRLFNIRRGIRKEDDILPERFLNQPLERGGAANRLPPLKALLEDYYRVRGWDKEGIPSKEKIESLGISNLINLSEIGSSVSKEETPLKTI